MTTAARIRIATAVLLFAATCAGGCSLALFQDEPTDGDGAADDATGDVGADGDDDGGPDIDAEDVPETADDGDDGEADVPPGCQDGTREGEEECDDGNDVPGDGCEPDCRFSCHEDTECDDADPCTLDDCVAEDGGQACSSIPDASLPPCDDGDPCTANDRCDSAGACITGTPYTCETRECVTASTCDGAGGCTETFADSGDRCDDGDPCTDGTSCDGAGTCTGGTNICECLGLTDCTEHEDGNACNGTLICDATHHCVVDPGTIVTCDPSGDSTCRQNRCDMATGICGMTSEADGTGCDDGNFCTTGDNCVTGACVGPTEACPLVGCVTGCNAATRTCIVAAAGAVCNASTGPCDPAEVCDGGTTVCPANVLAAAGTVCRPAPLPCDVPELCDGVLAACPDETFAVSGLLCRASTGPCDPAEYCPGTQADCVPDGFLPATTPCDDSNACTVGEACQLDHTCRGGTQPPPPTPIPLAPQNGALTGSYLATLGTVDPLRPAFRWQYADDGCGAADFSIQLTPDCPTLFSACTFATGVIPLVATSSQRVVVPATDLAVQPTPPVGGRYYWRMRACRTTSPTNCSAWTAVRYVDVGRVPGDFNGDGRSDVAIGACSQGASGAEYGAVFVYYGAGTRIPTTPDATLPAPASESHAQFGFAVAVAGDLDADGYADLIVGAPAVDAGGRTDEGKAYLYYGGPAGLPAAPTVTLDNPSAVAAARFGEAVAGVGDLNANGYADVLVGAPLDNTNAAGEGRAFVYLGRSGHITPTSSIAIDLSTSEAGAHFGRALAGGGDVNGDGNSDFAIAAPDGGGLDNRGRVFVYSGAVGATPFRSFATLSSSRAEAGDFGVALAGGGDLDGDAFSDLVVGSLHDDPGTDAGVAYAYFGGATGFSTALTIKSPLPTASAAADGRFSETLSIAGDAQADGFADLLVGAPGQTYLGLADHGAAYFFPGNAARSYPSAAAVLVPNPRAVATGDDLYGSTVAWVGDYNATGLSDVLIAAEQYDNPESDEGNAWAHAGTTTGLSGTAAPALDNPADDSGGLFGCAVGQP